MISLQTVLFQAWRSIGLSGMRSVLAVFSISIGVAAMIALMNIGHNTKRSILQEFDSFGYRLTKMDIYQLEDDASLDVIKSLNKIIVSSPMVHASEVVATSYAQINHRGEETDIALHAVSSTFEDRMKLAVAAGRALSDGVNDRPYIVLGHHVADALQGDGGGVLPGSLVTLNNHETYLIAGILSEYGETSLLAGGVDGAVFVLNHGIYKRSAKSESATNLIFRETGSDYEEIETQVRSVFQANAPSLAFELLSPEQVIASVSRQKRTQNILVTSLALVSLLTGGVGIMNIMLVSVQERTAEIGVRIAMGARPRDVRMQITIEAVILCVLGCALGVILGLGATFIYTWLQQWVFHASAQAILYSVSASVLIGVFFGYYPARLASKLDPIKALMS